MLTFDLNFDIAKPYSQALKVPANTPYILRVNVLENGQPKTLWGESSSQWDAIPVAASYQPKTTHADKTHTTWTNAPIDDYKPGILASDNAISAAGNILTLKCAPHSKGSEVFKFLINTTTNSFENISKESIATGDGTYALPERMAVMELKAHWNCNVSLNPAEGGIEMTGSYVDGEEFSFSIAGVENQLS